MTIKRIIIYHYSKDKHEKEDASLQFRLKKIDETRRYLLEEIKYNELIRNTKRFVRF